MFAKLSVFLVWEKVVSSPRKQPEKSLLSVTNQHSPGRGQRAAHNCGHNPTVHSARDLEAQDVSSLGLIRLQIKTRAWSPVEKICNKKTTLVSLNSSLRLHTQIITELTTEMQVNNLGSLLV